MRSAPLRSAPRKSAPRTSADLQVGVAEIGADEVCASEAGAPQVGAPQALADQIGSAAIDVPTRRLSARQLTGAAQQVAYSCTSRSDINRQERISASVGEALDVVERTAQLGSKRRLLRAAQRFGQIPRQLVELPHDAKYLEHPRRDGRRPPPVLAAERHLGNLLSRAEAVVDRAARKAALPQRGVNTAAEVRLQMHARLPGGFVNGKVRRGRKRGRDAAQPETAFAVGSVSL